MLTIPDFTASYSGFVNGDTPADLTQASLTTSATSSSTVGLYPINVAGASSRNYTITYVPGTLAITKAGSSAASSVWVGTVVVGQTDRSTAKVGPMSPGVGTPTGQVTFLFDGTPAATVALNPASGLASFSTSSVAQARTSVTVIYTGDSNFLASRSTSSSFVVATASTQSSLTAEAVRNRRKANQGDPRGQVLVVLPGIGAPWASSRFSERASVSRRRPWLTAPPS